MPSYNFSKPLIMEPYVPTRKFSVFAVKTIQANNGQLYDLHLGESNENFEDTLDNGTDLISLANVLFKKKEFDLKRSGWDEDLKKEFDKYDVARCVVYNKRGHFQILQMMERNITVCQYDIFAKMKSTYGVDTRFIQNVEEQHLQLVQNFTEQKSKMRKRRVKYHHLGKDGKIIVPFFPSK